MIKNIFLMTTAVFLGLTLFLLGECHFLIPYRHLLLAKYGMPIATFATALFFNLFAGIYLIGRKLFLKDTGRKLAHLEKQLRTGSGLSDELRRRLQE